MPSSRGSSPPRDPTHVSCIGRSVFTTDVRLEIRCTEVRELSDAPLNSGPWGADTEGWGGELHVSLWAPCPPNSPNRPSLLATGLFPASWAITGKLFHFLFTTLTPSTSPDCRQVLGILVLK